MREILFRGKRADNCEWVYGDLIRDCICNTTVQHIGYYLYGEVADIENDDVVSVIPESVGQYTGLKDNNGKKIFEGDIVTYAEDGIRGDFSQGVMEIVWNEKTANFCGRTEHANLVEIAHQKM